MDNSGPGEPFDNFLQEVIARLKTNKAIEIDLGLSTVARVTVKADGSLVLEINSKPIPMDKAAIGAMLFGLEKLLEAIKKNVIAASIVPN